MENPFKRKIKVKGMTKKVKEVKFGEDRDPEFKFPLGSRLKDKITGFEGVCIVRVQYLNQCNHYSLKPTELDKDGKPRDSVYFDEPQLVLVEEKVFEERAQEEKVGGPSDYQERSSGL